ncbi:branched-chain amino acid ABC transporter permease [Acrocarpospora catenulata]|uniref:branched-chain amino acid ABC transporter permease n=1 Tax=Acrocarpospora catenulata TaxID=2836182 RepID=UPI001BD97A0D|nr:branched-chain amino acid ABC transporter permease [Acrocarpospora catenulata]
MSTFLQLTFAGLNVGFLYMLVALGMVVTYQVSRVESLAQGTYVVYSALIFGSVRDGLGWPLAALASLLACAGIAVFLYLLALNRLATRGETGPVIMLLGGALLFAELARQFWGLNDRSAKPWLSNEPLRIFGATVLPHSLLMWAGAAFLVIAGFVLFERTMLGKALRAAADDVEGARIVGINTKVMQFVSFQVAGFFGAAAGILLSPIMPFGWTWVFALALTGAIGAIAGRWEYVPVALASLAIGLFASYAGGYISTSWQDVYIYGAFIVVLLLLREDKRAGTRRRHRRGGSSGPRIENGRATASAAAGHNSAPVRVPEE